MKHRIGVGGTAEVYFATVDGLRGFRKSLAIKKILPMFSDDESAKDMFVEEAKLHEAIRHPNVVTIYDLGEIDQQLFIALEYVDGHDLRQTLAACGKKKVGFPTDVALHVVVQALRGLDYAHALRGPDGRRLGIIHRDVSPSNILLSYQGEVLLGDFGIAKAFGREHTATGVLKGKIGYMAPEQVAGHPMDHRVDIFAMGIVLYELLTGHRLFGSKNSLPVLERVRDAVIEPPLGHYRQDLDVELQDIVMRALSKVPSDRFDTAGSFHDALQAYIAKKNAQLSPIELGRFLQEVFLTDPAERARRFEWGLPKIPTPELGRELTADVVLTDHEGRAIGRLSEPTATQRDHEESSNILAGASPVPPATAHRHSAPADGHRKSIPEPPRSASEPHGSQSPFNEDDVFAKTPEQISKIIAQLELARSLCEEPGGTAASNRSARRSHSRRLGSSARGSDSTTAATVEQVQPPDLPADVSTDRAEQWQPSGRPRSGLDTPHVLPRPTLAAEDREEPEIDLPPPVDLSSFVSASLPGQERGVPEDRASSPRDTTPLSESISSARGPNAWLISILDSRQSLPSPEEGEVEPSSVEARVQEVSDVDRDDVVTKRLESLMAAHGGSLAGRLHDGYDQDYDRGDRATPLPVSFATPRETSNEGLILAAAVIAVFLSAAGLSIAIRAMVAPPRYPTGHLIPDQPEALPTKEVSPSPPASRQQESWTPSDLARDARPNRPRARPLGRRNSVLRIRCPYRVDIQISGLGTMTTNSRRFSRQRKLRRLLPAGAYIVTFSLDETQLGRSMIRLVSSENLVVDCPPRRLGPRGGQQSKRQQSRTSEG